MAGNGSKVIITKEPSFGEYQSVHLKKDVDFTSRNLIFVKDGFDDTGAESDSDAEKIVFTGTLEDGCPYVLENVADSHNPQDQQEEENEILISHSILEHGDDDEQTGQVFIEVTNSSLVLDDKGQVKENTTSLSPREGLATSLDKQFACQICQKLFTRIEILKRHLKTHLNEKEFKCTYCNKAFDRRDVLNDHLRNHTGEKPFQCSYCMKKFTRGFVLLRHMRTHEEGSHKCKFCLKTFDRKDTFRDHIRNHTGEKPFKCKYCYKSFSRSFVLTKHMKAHETRVEGGDMVQGHSIGTNYRNVKVEMVDPDSIVDLDVDDDDEDDLDDDDDEFARNHFVSVGNETVLVDNSYYKDKSSLEAELLSRKSFSEITEGSIVMETGDAFQIINTIINPDQLISDETVIEEVVESEEMTFSSDTSDARISFLEEEHGQVVRVFSRNQFGKLTETSSKQNSGR